MSRNAQGPRSTRGLSISKSDRKRLARLDRDIGWFDRAMACVLVQIEEKRMVRLQSERAKLDARRKALRLAMKAKKKARLRY